MKYRGLEDAIALAATYHSGQKDKAGEPYVLHVLRVMLRFPGSSDDVARQVAVLHDIVEDTAITLRDLTEWGYRSEVVQAVEALTRRRGEAYEAYLVRVKSNPLACRVKMADLKDNLGRTSWAVTDQQRAEMARLREGYEGALVFLAYSGPVQATLVNF